MEKLFNQLINQTVKVEDEVPASNTQKALIENLLKEIERLIWELTENRVTLKLPESLNKKGAEKLFRYFQEVKKKLEKFEEFPAYQEIEDKEVIKAFTDAHFHLISRKHQGEKR